MFAVRIIYYFCILDLCVANSLQYRYDIVLNAWMSLALNMFPASQFNGLPKIKNKIKDSVTMFSVI